MKNLTNEELVQMFNNAWKTYAGCHGHYKSEMNKSLAMDYQTELKFRGIEIKPMYDKSGNLIDGIFNGIGSY